MECKGLHSVEHFPLSQWPSGHSRLGFQSFGIYHSSIQSGVQLQSKRVILPPFFFSSADFVTFKVAAVIRSK